MPYPNHCNIDYSVIDEAWVATTLEGKFICKHKEERICGELAHAKGFNIQNVHLSTEPGFVKSLLAGGYLD